MEQVLEYISLYLPTLIAIFAECGIIKFAIKVLKEARETKEFKAVVEQNKILVQELREANKLNRELLTQIDKISRE